MLHIRGQILAVVNTVFNSGIPSRSKHLGYVGIRLCHYSNSGRRPYAVVDAINVQAHRKSSRTETRFHDSDLIKQLNDIVFGKMESVSARNSLESRLGTLESMGCSLNDIQQYPQILRLSEAEVISRAQRLKKMGVKAITVEGLKAARYKSDKTVARKLHLLANEDFAVDERKTVVNVDRKLKGNLHGTPEEWLEILNKNPEISVVLNNPKILKKLTLLQKYGVSLDLIKANPVLLEKSLVNLKMKLSKFIDLKKTQTVTQKEIDYVLEDKNDPEQALKEKEKKQQQRLKYIADLLDVNVSEIADVKPSSTISKTFAEKKINFLVGKGIEKHDIANHFYFLNNSLAKMEKAVETAHEAGILKPSLVLLVNILQHKCIPQRQSHARQLYTIADLLEVPRDYFTSRPALRVLGLADRLSVKKNLLFLMKEGFSKKDILACPLILGHDPDVLVSSYESLPDRLEEDVYVEIGNNKSKILNILQYLIESGVNFNCKELILQAGKHSDCSSDIQEPSESSDVLDLDD